ncbi:potassium channel family protein [Thalassotalea fusca]
MTTKDNFIYLTIALSTLLLGMALAQQFFAPSAQRLMQSATVVTLLAVVWGAQEENFVLRKALVFPLAIIVSALGGYWLDNANLEYAHLVLMLIFFILTGYQTAKQVLFTGRITHNKILGAICLYMLLGLIWALCYTLLELSLPNAFRGLSANPAWYELLPTFVYFSFVTLTTLGFGDITPNIPLGQFLVYMQAVVGQLYLAILVASLVGSRLSAMQESKSHSAEQKDE